MESRKHIEELEPHEASGALLLEAMNGLWHNPLMQPTLRRRWEEGSILGTWLPAPEPCASWLDFQ